MTTIQKLLAVIEAQVKGGCETWKPYYDAADELSYPGSHHKTALRTLGILLDPEGLKAAYGTEEVSSCCGAKFTFHGDAYYIYYQCKRDGCAVHIDGEDSWRFQPRERYNFVARDILEAWLHKGPDAAISTAFDLLPKESTL